MTTHMRRGSGDEFLWGPQMSTFGQARYTVQLLCTVQVQYSYCRPHIYNKEIQYNGHGLPLYSGVLMGLTYRPW